MVVGDFATDLIRAAVAPWKPSDNRAKAARLRDLSNLLQDAGSALYAEAHGTPDINVSAGLAKRADDYHHAAATVALIADTYL
jgi:hypothetical protein